jgi:hypothetical protein
MKQNKFCGYIITVVQITVIMDVLVIKSYGVHDRARVFNQSCLS